MRYLLFLTLILASPAFAACTDEEISKSVYIEKEQSRADSIQGQIDSLTKERDGILAMIASVEKGDLTVRSGGEVVESEGVVR